MSTRSAIIIENQDGTAEGVYCHFDGYPEHHKPILLENYQTEAIVRSLIGHGGISCLCEKIGEKHDFHSRDDDVCTFYHRDRGEDLDILRDKTWRKVAASIGHNGHVYVFRCATGSWMYAEDEADELRDLRDVSEEDDD